MFSNRCIPADVSQQMYSNKCIPADVFLRNKQNSDCRSPAEKRSIMEKLDFLTKLLMRKGMSLNDSITFKNIFASFMLLVFVLYIAFGYIAVRVTLKKTALESPAAVSEQDELPMDQRIEPLQEEAPQQEEGSFRSIARKAGSFMLRLMFFVILALTCFILYEANILWIFLPLYGLICIYMAFRPNDFVTTLLGFASFRIMLGTGIAMTVSGGVLSFPQRKREKLEKQLSSKESRSKNGSGGNRGSGGSDFIL